MQNGIRGRVSGGISSKKSIETERVNGWEIAIEAKVGETEFIYHLVNSPYVTVKQKQFRRAVKVAEKICK